MQYSAIFQCGTARLTQPFTGNDKNKVLSRCKAVARKFVTEKTPAVIILTSEDNTVWKYTSHLTCRGIRWSMWKKQ